MKVAGTIEVTEVYYSLPAWRVRLLEFPVTSGRFLSAAARL
jgi:hypothetical protein